MSTDLPGSMPLLFTGLGQLSMPSMGLKQAPVCIPVFIHGDYKEASLDTQNKQNIKDFVLNDYSFTTEEEDDEKQHHEGFSNSSSIGAQSSSSPEEDDETGENEVQSKLKDDDDVFTSLNSLETSLPIKRGLSNFFTGKSKSFASLSDASVVCAKDLAKQENPINKRRRIFLANKISWGRRASYSSFSPEFLLKEGENEEEEMEDDKNEEEKDISFMPPSNILCHGDRRGFVKSFKSLRSFSLSDLQHV